MMPDSIICWKWSTPGYRSTFTADTVNALFTMVRRHYPEPFRAICVTDDADGIDASIEIVADEKDFADVPSPHGGKNPSCYRRLRMFRPDAGAVFGRRFASMDLDCVVTGDLRPLFNRHEDLVMWGDTNKLPRSHYNGSLLLMTAGTRSKVWTEFDPRTSPRRSLAAKAFGSDQGWISYVLGPGEAKWSKADGVYSYRNDLARRPDALPTDARLVFMHGNSDPWSTDCQRVGWIRQHYPMPARAA